MNELFCGRALHIFCVANYILMTHCYVAKQITSGYCDYDNL